MNATPLPRNYTGAAGPDRRIDKLHDGAELRESSRRLHANGFIDWHVEGRDKISATEYTEWIFLNHLLACGLTIEQLPRLLAGLEKPYLYSHSEIFFHFGMERWELIGKQEDHEGPLVGTWYNTHTHYVVEGPPSSFPCHDVFSEGESPSDYSYPFTLEPVLPHPRKRLRRLRYGDIIRVEEWT